MLFKPSYIACQHNTVSYLTKNVIINFYNAILI